MKISTRGRYALRVMLDLAEHNNGEYIPLMDIAKRQEISEKYLESIVSVLSKQKVCKGITWKRRRISSGQNSGRIYDRQYFKNYRRLNGTGSMS